MSALRGIDAVKEERRKGWGAAAAAKPILGCLVEGLCPAWDAANKISIRLAEERGRKFSCEYVVCGMEYTARQIPVCRGESYMTIADYMAGWIIQPTFSCASGIFDYPDPLRDPFDDLL